MSSPNCQVGFSQRIRLEWLEYTPITLAGNSRSAVADAAGTAHGQGICGREAERSNRLRQSHSDEDMEPLRLNSKPSHPRTGATSDSLQDRIVLHWE